MFSGFTPEAMSASRNGRTSSLLVPMFCLAMPLTFTQTMSSLWTNCWTAVTRSGLPVSSIIARVSISFAASGLG